MSEASAYFNSLPLEQRLRLAPLLEEYRRLGMAEYARAVRAVTAKMDARISGRDPTQCVVAVAEIREGAL